MNMKGAFQSIMNDLRQALDQLIVDTSCTHCTTTQINYCHFHIWIHHKLFLLMLQPFQPIELQIDFITVIQFHCVDNSR